MPTTSHSIRQNLTMYLPALIVFMLTLFMLPLNVQADITSDGSNKPSAAEQLKLAERLIYKEKYSLAIKKLKQTLKKDKKSADAWNLLGFASRKSGDTETAENAYQKALSINKDHLGALEYQGELFITLGRLDDAKGNLDRLNELCPDGCDEQAELADALAKAN